MLHKKSVDDLKTDTHKKNQDTALGDGTKNYVTAEEIRKHLDKTGGGGGGVVVWATNAEIHNGSAVLDETTMILYEGIALTDPFTFKGGANIDADVLDGKLKPILTIEKPRTWAAVKRFETGEMIKGTDNKLYFVQSSYVSGTTFKADVDSKNIVVVGGGHDKGYDDTLAKDTEDEVTAKEIRKHLDKDAIVPGIPDWKAGTKYMDDQPLLDPITKIIYRVIATVSPYYITTGATIKADIEAGKIELISEYMLEELKAHIMSTQDDGNSYVNTTTKIDIEKVPYNIIISNNINDDNKNIVQVWKLQETDTEDVTTIVKDFNNSDKTNFEGDLEGVVFDGSMYQKDTIEITTVSTTALGSGYVSEFEPINTTGMISIVSIKAVIS